MSDTEPAPLRAIPSNAWGWGRPFVKLENLDMMNFPLWIMQLTIVAPLLYFLYSWSSFGTIFLYWIVFPVALVLMALLTYAAFIFGASHIMDVSEKSGPLNVADHVEYKDAELKRVYVVFSLCKPLYCLRPSPLFT